MNVAGALRARDREIKLLVREFAFKHLPEEQHQAFSERLNEIFNNSTMRWPKMLVPFIDQDRADKINGVLRQELI